MRRARAGVSAFGFGGTNFHAVLEEYVPGRAPAAGERDARTLRSASSRRRARTAHAPSARQLAAAPSATRRRCVARWCSARPPKPSCVARLAPWSRDARAGVAPAPAPPDSRRPARTGAPRHRLRRRRRARAKGAKALQGARGRRRRRCGGCCSAQGVFLGRGRAGQGRVPLHRAGLAVRQHAARPARARARRRRACSRSRRGDDAAARRARSPSSSSSTATTRAPSTQLEEQLKQTEITQPAVLATRPWH